MWGGVYTIRFFFFCSTWWAEQKKHPPLNYCVLTRGLGPNVDRFLLNRQFSAHVYAALGDPQMSHCFLIVCLV